MKKDLLSPALKRLLGISLPLAAALLVGWLIWTQLMNDRSRAVLAWIRNPSSHPEWERQALSSCPSAPFIFPTTGFPGYVWGDSFRPGHRHQGIDIFSPGGVGETPVYAAYPGYLTRKPGWKSSLIIRIPEDPLRPEHQIWTYYTHLADAEGRSLIAEAFPPGTEEIYVERGTLLGTQGNYSGTPGSPVGIHLHFSIVKDDGNGTFLNELFFSHTLDPSPYFGLPLNASTRTTPVPSCLDSPQDTF